MSDDGPDWEAAARASISGEITDVGRAALDECHGIAEQLADGETLQTDDVEQLMHRIEELDCYVNRVLWPIAEGEWSDQYIDDEDNE